MIHSKQNDWLDESTIELVRSILQVTAGYNWLVDTSARIITCNNLARELSNNADRLPVLDGPQVQIDLSELLFTALYEKKPIELKNLELCLPQHEPPRLTHLQIHQLDLTKAWPKLFLINLTCSCRPAEQTVETIQNEKLNSLTGLAAKIAHELNNPLDGSMRYIGLAIRRLQHSSEMADSPAKVAEYLSSAQEALGKMNGILSDLVQFATQRPGKYRKNLHQRSPGAGSANPQRTGQARRSQSGDDAFRKSATGRRTPIVSGLLQPPQKRYRRRRGKTQI